MQISRREPGEGAPQTVKTTLIYPFRKKNFRGCNPPISLLYLAAALRNAGEEVTVMDSDDGDLSQADLVKRVAESRPDLVGVPLYSADLNIGHRLVDLLGSGDPPWKIALGGPHPTAMPDRVLEAFPACDYVIRGEAEQTLVDLVAALEGRTGLDSVKGLSFREGDKIVHNPDASPQANMDAIPFPARDLLAGAYDRKVYWRVGHRGTTDIMITSRGCPYSCHFCFKMSKRYRLRSPENILAELASIRAQGTRSVHIMDDLFVWDKPRCLKILSMIREQKLGIELKVRARVDGIDEELLAAMKETGVKSVVYGIESGSQKILDLMNKRTTVDMNYKAISATKKIGLQCYADAFIGFPGETPETLRETQDFFLKSKPTALAIAVLSPFPNTWVYEKAKAEGTLVGDWDLANPRPWVKLPWTPDFDTLVKWRRKIYTSYLRQPAVAFGIARSLILQTNLKQARIAIRQHLRRTIDD